MLETLKHLILALLTEAAKLASLIESPSQTRAVRALRAWIRQQRGSEGGD